MYKLELVKKGIEFVIHDEDTELIFEVLDDKKGFVGASVGSLIEESTDISDVACRLTLVDKIMKEINGVEIVIEQEFSIVEIFVPIESFSI